MGSDLLTRTFNSVRAFVERSLLRLGVLGAGGARRERVVVVTTSGANIGDQALFEAFVRHSPLPVDAIVDDVAEFGVPVALRDKVTLHPFRHYTYGRNVQHVVELVQIGRLIGTSRATVVLGADVMDGAYSASLSSVRWSVAQVAASVGRRTSVISMSWNGRPAPGMLALARSAGEAGVLLCPRDPDSHARLVDAGLDRARLTADIVFTIDEITPPDADLLTPFVQWRDEDRPLVLLNISALIGTPAWAVDEYQQIARGLAEVGAQLLLVPHVQRPGNDDAQAQDRALPPEQFPEVHRLPRLLDPTQIAWLADRASLVVTGRMHLSILSMGRGVPAVVLSTQGKVSGLLASMGVPDHCVDPAPGMAGTILRHARASLDDAERIRAVVAEHLPVVRARAQAALDAALPRG